MLSLMSTFQSQLSSSSVVVKAELPPPPMPPVNPPPNPPPNVGFSPSSRVCNNINELYSTCSIKTGIFQKYFGPGFFQVFWELGIGISAVLLKIVEKIYDSNFAMF